MAGNNRIDSGHELAPLIADGMKIGVADTAEKDFDLHVVFGWVASRNGRSGKWRGRTGSGIGFRVKHTLSFLALNHI